VLGPLSPFGLGGSERRLAVGLDLHEFALDRIDKRVHLPLGSAAVQVVLQRAAALAPSAVTVEFDPGRPRGARSTDVPVLDPRRGECSGAPQRVSFRLLETAWNMAISRRSRLSLLFSGITMQKVEASKGARGGDRCAPALISLSLDEDDATHVGDVSPLSRRARRHTGERAPTLGG
jgi:hypothetical protein